TLWDRPDDLAVGRTRRLERLAARARLPVAADEHLLCGACGHRPASFSSRRLKKRVPMGPGREPATPGAALVDTVTQLIYNSRIRPGSTSPTMDSTPGCGPGSRCRD